jgi:xylulose-5-phosphate/fructose-6-phosphate phosphoketolase
VLTVPLDLPPFTEYAIPVPRPATEHHESTRQLGLMLRDIYRKNPTNFRLVCPDETNSNRLGAVFEASKRCLMEPTFAYDESLGPDGRVMEVLSEHNCQGWLEGYVLTGRHGLFATYEAFALIIASMATQHAKWLEVSDLLPWRKPVPSLNYLLTSTCWRNDHNGFSHQGPGFMDTIVSKKGTVARVYLPPDANCLLSVADHCLRSKNYVTLIIIDKQPQLQWLAMDDARAHGDRGGRARHRPGVCRRHTDARDDGGRLVATKARAVAASARRERRGSPQSLLSARAPARDARRSLRRALHARHARMLLVSWLCLGHSPAPPRTP